MPDDRAPGGLPPDLPPEYAEAYRRGFERAYGAAAPEDDGPPADDREQQARTAAVAEVEETQRLDVLEEALTSSPRRPYAGPSHRVTGDERPAWLVPALLAGLIAILLVSAYGMGLLLSSSVSDQDLAEPEPDGVVIDEGSSPSAGAPKKPKKPKTSRDSSPREPRYNGRTEPTTIGGATASCQSPASVDAAGNRVVYPSQNAYDGDLTTAWRCDGSGVGQTLTLSLPADVEIGEVGLVPGYAKTDPRSGADRYAENNRITRVRWTFSDGTSVVQRLDGSPTNRELQSARIPLTTADEVVIEVLASRRGARDTIAISEVLVGAATD